MLRNQWTKLTDTIRSRRYRWRGQQWSLFLLTSDQLHRHVRGYLASAHFWHKPASLQSIAQLQQLFWTLCQSSHTSRHSLCQAEVSTLQGQISGFVLVCFQEFSGRFSGVWWAFSCDCAVSPVFPFPISLFVFFPSEGQSLSLRDLQHRERAKLISHTLPDVT